jgi:hypothetical protein
MTTRLQGALTLLIALGGAGCSLATEVAHNSEGIQASTASIRANSDAIAQSTRTMTDMVPALTGLQRLQTPMESVAKLEPTLRSVAALDTSMRSLTTLVQPMTRLTELGPRLDSVAALYAPLVRVADLRSSLDGVVALREPLGRVASLSAQLDAVSALGGPLKEVSALRQPLAQLAGLAGALDPLIAAAAVLQHPAILVVLAVLALAVWAAVTYFAVRLAMTSAMRAAAPGHS